MCRQLWSWVRETGGSLRGIFTTSCCVETVIVCRIMRCMWCAWSLWEGGRGCVHVVVHIGRVQRQRAGHLVVVVVLGTEVRGDEGAIVLAEVIFRERVSKLPPIAVCGVGVYVNTRGGGCRVVVRVVVRVVLVCWRAVVRPRKAVSAIPMSGIGIMVAWIWVAVVGIWVVWISFQSASAL